MNSSIPFPFPDQRKGSCGLSQQRALYMQAIRAALERKGLEVDADRGDGLSVWMLLMLRVSCHVLPLSSVLYPHDDTAFSATDMVQVLCCLSGPVAFKGTLHAIAC